MSPSRELWFDRAFGEFYPLVYAHRDEACAAREVDFVRRIVPILPTHRVLDLGCGAGRHVEAMRAAGIRNVHGLDRSWSLLMRASLGLSVFRGDMRTLPISSAALDIVTSFFTSFGYFETSSEDMSVLEEVVRVLRPNGRYFLDYMDAAHVRRSLIPRSERTVGAISILEERSIVGSRVMKSVRIKAPDGKEEHYEESVRLYDPDEMLSMLDAVGLRPLATYSDLEGRSAGTGPRWIVVAERGVG